MRYLWSPKLRLFAGEEGSFLRIHAWILPDGENDRVHIFRSEPSVRRFNEEYCRMFKTCQSRTPWNNILKEWWCLTKSLLFMQFCLGEKNVCLIRMKWPLCDWATSWAKMDLAFPTRNNSTCNWFRTCHLLFMVYLLEHVNISGLSFISHVLSLSFVHFRFPWMCDGWIVTVIELLHTWSTDTINGRIF